MSVADSTDGTGCLMETKWVTLWQRAKQKRTGDGSWDSEQDAATNTAQMMWGKQHADNGQSTAVSPNKTRRRHRNSQTSKGEDVRVCASGKENSECRQPTCTTDAQRPRRSIPLISHFSCLVSGGLLPALDVAAAA